jgi:DinB superfamily
MKRNSKNHTEPIRSLLRALDEGYDHAAWHGTNLKGSLRGLTPAEALWRPAPGRHCIWEEVLHAAYWKHAVRRRLMGGKRSAFPVKGSNWFAAPESGGQKEWNQAKGLLEETHRALRAAVEQFPVARIEAAVSGSKWSAFDSILGIAFHDVYHAGQVQMLRRLRESRAH